MYFPVDKVTRKMEYYIGNRGDERKWNKRTEVRVPQTSSHPSWDVLSSEVQCRLNMEGLYLEILLFQNGLRFLSEELSDEGGLLGDTSE